MSDKISDLTEDELIIDFLALQYIQGKAVNSAAEYVTLYAQAREEIKASYSKIVHPFNSKAMI